MTSKNTVAANVIDLINLEADLLDHKSYDEWLQLWTDDGLYIVPVDTQTTDFANAVNFAYDDAEMRHLRTARLMGGESVSSGALDKTVRSVSRFRLLEETETTVRVRCATTINEVRAGRLLSYPGDVEFELVKGEEGLRIRKKIVRLLHAASYLATVAFIF
ncbi:aromatic-ring-hydroxylating dioxygenase subunit beta [Thauera sp.]|uniref:aromatic-ring-hydroxylating dioxygenase subunit beta n=1 Tax=Thauera sp. TaxID=1905334 RepID=UPI0039E4D593